MTTPFYAAVLVFVYIGLSVRVLRLRGSLGVSLGPGEDGILQRAIRVHGNFSEYVPLTLLCLYFLELRLQAAWPIHALAGAFILGRLIHAYGVAQINENSRLRVVGMGLTFTPLSITALALIYMHMFAIFA